MSANLKRLAQAVKGTGTPSREELAAEFKAVFKNPDLFNTFFDTYTEMRRSNDRPTAISNLREEIRDAKANGRMGGLNHLGEQEQTTYAGWKRKMKGLGADKFDGDMDICEALKEGKGLGHWDGEKGCVYGSKKEAQLNAMATIKKDPSNEMAPYQLIDPRGVPFENFESMEEAQDEAETQGWMVTDEGEEEDPEEWMQNELMEKLSENGMRATSYEEAGVLTNNKGLEVRTPRGKFQITINFAGNRY